MVLGILASATLAGCYNPINASTAERYRQICDRAEARGRLEEAEEACRRALINVQVGHLGPQIESQALYNLSRVKMQLGNHAEAEGYLKRSLQLEEEQSPPDGVRISWRLANLALATINQQRLGDAWPHLVRLMPLADQFSGQDREDLRKFLDYASEQYLKQTMSSEAMQLRQKADSLR